MSPLYRFVFVLLIMTIFAAAAPAQESTSIRVTATVVNPDIVKASASFDDLDIAEGPYSKIVILKPGSGNLQLEINSPAGADISRSLEPEDGALYHRELLMSGRKVSEESSFDPDEDSVTTVTLIYTDI